ncbi:hypothetical protein PGTUg99_004601 [Puccinia graminis f. sp. tritici]|uniref:Uncharacterized protein n=2 Tax=Puccinia graminis f. sp. tritici TaxID=56615 RepID=A0A5B0S6I5_PUCGR|nr:hypothetical protein PGTUg99_004601 [Puccinia graminis f. sp. tritici]
MPADSAQEFLSFVLHLPPSLNPYTATAEKMRQLTEIHAPPLWARIIRRIITIQFIILCAQCFTVLWLRKKANQLKFFRFNKLGLIHIEVLNEIVLSMFIFSALCAFDLGTEELVELRLLDFSNKFVVRTSKFLVTGNVFCCLLTGYCHWYFTLVRMFLWISGIEAAMAFTSLRARARAGSSIRQSLFVRCAANGSFLAILTIPSAVILWLSVRAALNLRAIEIATKKIISGLLKAAPTYQPHTYQLMKLLEILKPAEGFAIHMQHLLYDTRVIVLMFLVFHLVVTTLHLPTSVLALRGIRNHITPARASKKGAQEDPALGYQTSMMKRMNDGPAQERAALESVRKRLVIYSGLVYLDTVLYCPLLAYMYSYKGAEFLDNSTWMVVEQIGTHAHTAIVGNIILAVLIQNTMYTTGNTVNGKASEHHIVVEQGACKVGFVCQPTKSEEFDLQVRSVI